MCYSPSITLATIDMEMIIMFIRNSLNNWKRYSKTRCIFKFKTMKSQHCRVLYYHVLHHFIFESNIHYPGKFAKLSFELLCTQSATKCLLADGENMCIQNDICRDAIFFKRQILTEDYLLARTIKHLSFMHKQCSPMHIFSL